MAAILRLATFNLENLDDRPRHGPPIDARLAVLRPQLLRLAADVICLQEVNGQALAGHGARRLRALDRLLDDTPYADYHRAATGGEHGPFDVHNLVVLSRFPIIEQGQLRHQMVEPPRYRMVTAAPPAAGHEPVEWDRPVLHVGLDLGRGGRLDVINLHLRAPLAAPVPGQKEGPFAWKSVAGWAEGFYLASLKRGGQALEARLLIDRLFDADPGALIAVCGDFNATAQEVPLRIVMGDAEDTGNGALAGRAMVALERSVSEDQRYSVLHGGRKIMLDHVVVSRPLLTWYRGAEIHNEGLGDELVAYASGQDSPQSYHAPVVAEFEHPGA